MDYRMVTLDLGCGFVEGLQASIQDAVGIDLNFQSGKVMVDHPITGDVNYVPLRRTCVDFVHAHAILEHLPMPQLCLNEMKRVMRAGAQGSILLPVDSYSIRQVLGRFIKEFPFSLPWVMDKLIRSVTLWKIPGLLHVSQIEIEDIEKWFKVDHDKIQVNRRLHKWFVHLAPFTPFCRLGWVRRLEVDEYAEVVIPICRY